MDKNIALGYQRKAKMRSIVFFLVPHFTMLPFSAAIETLRIANRMLGYSAYTWRLASTDGEKVTSSSGIAIEVNSSVAEERRNLGGESRPTMALISSGIYVEEFENKSVNAWLREYYNRGVAVGSLCTGAHVLAQAGLLNVKFRRKEADFDNWAVKAAEKAISPLVFETLSDNRWEN